MTDKTVQERVERATTEEMDVSLECNDPVVVQVHNEKSDRVHTVIPEAVHCSCEDHTYRKLVCKHIIRLLQDESYIGEIMRESIKEHRNELEAESAHLRDRIEQVERRIDLITDTLSAVDADQHMIRTEQEVIDAVRDGESNVPFDPISEMAEELANSAGDDR